MTHDNHYVYGWKNNTRRAELYGRRCRVIVRSTSMNSCLIEFADDRTREVVSRNALRRVKDGDHHGVEMGETMG